MRDLTHLVFVDVVLGGFHDGLEFSNLACHAFKSLGRRNSASMKRRDADG